MIEIKDRVPTKPNRVKLTSEEDGTVKYYTLSRADEPTVDGTPINKELFDSIQTDIDNLNKNGKPNLIINGDFKIWQRYNSFGNIQNKYCADRFYLYNPTNQTEYVEKSDYVPDGRFANSIHITSRPTDNTHLRYKLTEVLKGTFTLSFWYKSTVVFKTFIYDGGEIQLGESNSNDEWTKAVYTFEANNLTYIDLIHSMTEADVYITGVKLEYGDYASEFISKPYDEELADCRKYFIKGHQDIMDAVTSTSTVFWGGTIPTMRTSPTITFTKIYEEHGDEVVLSAIKTFNVANGVLKNIIFTGTPGSQHIRYVADLDAEIY